MYLLPMTDPTCVKTAAYTSKPNTRIYFTQKKSPPARPSFSLKFKNERKKGGGGVDRLLFLLGRLLFRQAALLLVEPPAEVPRHDPFHGKEPRDLVVVHLGGGCGGGGGVGGGEGDRRLPFRNGGERSETKQQKRKR